MTWGFKALLGKAAIAAAAIVALGLPPLVAASQRNRGAEEVVAVFPPWWPQGRTLAATAAQTELIAAGRLGFLVVARAPDASTRQRLREVGAWLLLDGAAVRFCMKDGEI